MSTAVSDPLVGQVLDGRYRVLRRLARGGMATVYEAVDTRLERVVAVKVMHPGLAEDKAFVARFIREARAAARLSHPAAVAVYDQSADSGHVFLAMEYVQGRTLRDWLRDKRRLTPREAFAVLEPVLAALAAAHHAGLVHRDIKPENVLIADDGRVKVADFGLARAVSTSTVTGTGSLIGTVAYLAPEQVERGVADHRSDVYAAGILLYECLTGLQPFTGETPLQVAYQHVNYDVPRPSEQAPGLPPELDALVLRATRRDPAGRPADAGAFLAEVVAVRRSLPPGALDAAVRGGAPVPVARDGATMVVPLPAANHTAPYPVPPRLARRRRRGVIALVAVLVAAVAIGIGSWQVAAGSSVPAPSLISLTAEAATARAAEEGLAVRFAEPGAYDEAMPAGQVLSTDPPAGENVRKNGTITATLSLGPERYDVPELEGLSVDDAGSRLAENNLVLGDDMTREYSDSVEQGDVVRSNPEGGTALPRDSVVEVVVSRGLRPVELPDVVGQTLDEATDLLSRLGFDIGDTDTEFDDAPAGQVISQDPGPDRRATRGQSVDLVVSRGPELVTVPSVVGMDAEEAVEVLEDAGLEADVDDFPGNFGDQVVAQDPDPGTQVPPGTTVRISVF